VTEAKTLPMRWAWRASARIVTRWHQGLAPQALAKSSMIVRHPPAEPRALPSLAPQRGRVATESESDVQHEQHCEATRRQGILRRRVFSAKRRTADEPTPGNVKLLLPPRQSRGISLGGLGVPQLRTEKCGMYSLTAGIFPDTDGIGPVFRRERLGGLLNFYYRVAA
jgi:hypothetical protein